MSETIISLEHLKKSYGKNHVLTDVNMEIEKGEIYGLIGANGSGKTTIFKIILGLSDYQGGTVRIGEPGDSLEKGRSRTGFFVGQNFFPYLDAVENLKYYANLKAVKNPKPEIERVLKLVGLHGTKTAVKGYSLGMRQRLGIANAMLGNPEVMIFDEPVNGLDPQGIADIRNMFQDVNKEFGTTIIISSHILGELQNTAYRFAILNQGKIVKVLSQADLQADSSVVRLSVNDVAKAREVLAREGIRVLKEKAENISLEDYYFEQIGGGEDK
ncbi:MAG: ATP-binding cassette domain-containing protein [Lachnospiraceae bacterium]|nr:ATP-binding cassette domain-containing protein [Candidatus Hippenecus merdae]MCQ2414480.1 ATP-binding cassette domain-containing protein [Lachnospiraceae bacterium]